VGGGVGREIEEMVEEIGELRTAFEEEGAFLSTSAYIRCVGNMHADWQHARVEALHAKALPQQQVCWCVCVCRCVCAVTQGT